MKYAVWKEGYRKHPSQKKDSPPGMAGCFLWVSIIYFYACKTGLNLYPYIGLNESLGGYRRVKKGGFKSEPTLLTICPV